jgi:hypothetical protein
MTIGGIIIVQVLAMILVTVALQPQTIGAMIIQQIVTVTLIHAATITGVIIIVINLYFY